MIYGKVKVGDLRFTTSTLAASAWHRQNAAGHVQVEMAATGKNQIGDGRTGTGIIYLAGVGTPRGRWPFLVIRGKGQSELVLADFAIPGRGQPKGG
jgi:hypothetical protein